MTKMNYRECGSGPVLICLHGYGGSVLHWEKVSKELQSHFRVVVPNLTHLYVGQNQYSFLNQVKELGEFIKQNFPNEKVHLAGVSYGGALCWALAIRFPELIERVIFVNPMPPHPARYFSMASFNLLFRLPLSQKFLQLFLSTGIGRTLLKQVAQVFRNLQGDYDIDRIGGLTGRKLHYVCHVIWRFSWILRQENWNYWQEALEAWSHDCLLIYDVKDPLYSNEFYDGFSEILASTNVVQTQNAGHISLVLQPKLIAGSIREYLLRNYFKDVEGYSW